MNIVVDAWYHKCIANIILDTIFVILFYVAANCKQTNILCLVE